MGADAVQLFTQSPRAWKPPTPNPELYEAFRAQREEAAMGAVFCHAIYLVNLAAPNDEVYEKSVATMRSTMDIACAIEADGVVFHVGSHLGSGFEHGLERVLPAMEQVLERCSERTWLLMENSAGAGAHDRPLDRGARDALREARPPPAARRSASTRAISTSRAAT